VASSSSSAAPAGELLPATRRALIHRVAVGQAEGRTPNPGYGLLGALVSQLRGHGWEEALRQEILDPLRMARTTVSPEPPHARGFAVYPEAPLAAQPDPEGWRGSSRHARSPCRLDGIAGRFGVVLPSRWGGPSEGSVVVTTAHRHMYWAGGPARFATPGPLGSPCYG
jgi:CubicO group peptidase (beta-lactamase class C family)